ncbi:agamous-like MADS-box protein AGL23 [Brachypodium distachyon]|uniref:agamous-like MADS-box protein AGL23 n=1 Tax=Brachypodium distachyon TaxID=15368 RepID=UPI00071E2128|nr:agamous-like MADS-box protein AGL23 [Brachypodium distachyon]|eukprot:XP_014754099.1 agamous-like MADS-box protein AGL23 [Brachypodium distachyon]
MPPRRRPSLGRQKVAMEPIQSNKARQVCFSKRRFGLFKKASELSVLCGVELAAVVFSPGGKAFSFCTPSVDAVVNRLLVNNNNNAAAPAAGGGGGWSSSAPAVATEGSSSSGLAPAAMAAEKLVELTEAYAELRAMMEREKLRKERAEEEMEREREAAGCPTAAWLDADLAELSEAELVEFQAALLEVKNAVDLHADDVLRETLTAAAAAPARSPLAMPMPRPRGFANSVYEVGGYSSGNNNGGGFANSVYEVAGSSSGNNNGGGATMGEMMQMDNMLQQLNLIDQIHPLPPRMGQIPPPGLGFPETMDLPPLPGMGFLDTMDLPSPDFGPDGGFIGPPPF